MTRAARLLSPFRLGDLDLPNRVVHAPLTRRRAGPGKVPDSINALYHAQRSDAALIITESTEVDPYSDGVPPTRPGLFNEHQANGWRLVTDAVHERGGRIFVQLNHLGRASHPGLLVPGRRPIAPSAVRAEGSVFVGDGFVPFVEPEALTVEGIAEVIEQFGEAARFARNAGFDGVEIHGANGYLIDQFLRDGSNQRTDDYGGDPQRRSRFLLEILTAVGRHWPRSRIGIRLSPLGTIQGMFDSNPVEHFTEVARLLDRHVAYLHLIGEGGGGTPPQSVLTPHIRRVCGVPIIAAGGYSGDFSAAEDELTTGMADLIAFGVAFLANPDLPERIRRGSDLNLPDQATFYGGTARGYTDYPALDDAEAM